MKRPIWDVLFLAVMFPYVTFRMWQTWGKPEFWPLVVFSLVFGFFVGKAGRDRQEDLRARLPGARTFGL